MEDLRKPARWNFPEFLARLLPASAPRTKLIPFAILARTSTLATGGLTTQ
jgi:hypothetical protein